MMEGAIQSSVPCVQCSHDLHGLPPEGVCPGCGTPVGPSLVPSRLVFADPRWRHNLTRAIELLYRTLPAMALVLVVLGGVFWPYLWSGQGTGVVVYRTLSSLALALGALVVVVGCLRTTAREPTATTDSKTQAERWAARAGAIACWVIVITVMLLPRFGIQLSAESASLILTLAFVFLCVAAVGLLGRLRRLAIRLPDAPLARNLLREMVIIAAAGGAIAVLSYMPLPMGQRLDGLRFIAGVVVLGGVWGYLRRFRRSQRRLAPLPTGGLP